MKQGPTFSIIIPTFNSLDLLHNALGSILMQKGDISFEIIITDDSSNNDIEKYIKSLGDNRISYFHNKPSLGAVRNWNQGLKNSNGEYVIVMHHDESFSDENILKTIEERLIENPDIILLNLKVYTNGISTRKKIFSHLAPIVLQHPTILFAINAIGPCACMVARRSHLQLFDDKLKWFVDVEWYYRLIKKAKKKIFLKDCYIKSINGHKGQITDNINIKETAVKDKAIITRKYSSLSIVNLMLTIGQILTHIHKRLSRS